MGKILIAAALATAGMCATGAAGQTDRAPGENSTKAIPNASGQWGVETIAVDLRASGEPLWSGTLRIGGRYGNAGFNQSKNEFAEPCAGKPSAYENASSNRQLNFNISRRNPQQDPDQFYVYVNWTQPLAACEGEETNTFGFNRVIELPAGKTVSIEGAGGLVVKLTRPG